MGTDQQRYLSAVHTVLTTTDATRRNWLGRRVKLRSGIPYQFAEMPVVGPQCVTVTLLVSNEDLGRVLALDERMAMQAGSQFARIYRDLSVVRVEFTLPFTEWQDVRLAELPHRRDAATIGRKALGPSARVGWELPHKTIFGSTQTGKSTCLADFVVSLAHHSTEEYRMLILNPKNDPVFGPFHRLAHLVAPVADNSDDSALLLRHALAEMNERRADPSRRSTRWVVIVDEVAQLVDERPDAGPAITQLTQLAGGLNINLVLASQAANPKVFGERGTLAKANLPSRLVFQLPSDQSYMATGLAGQHTERLAGKGDGLAVVGDRVTRFRAALPCPADYESLPRTESEPRWPDAERVAGDAAVDGWQVPPDMLHFALWEQGSATQIQRQFGGAMDRARLIRDYAEEFKKVHQRWLAHHRGGKR